MPYCPNCGQNHDATEYLLEPITWEYYGGQTPHKCPVCDGEGEVLRNDPFTNEIKKTCPVCQGACVLWR